MIKVKEFEYDHSGKAPLDERINNFLATNLIELVDVKYQANVSGYADSGIHASDYNSSALLIYREVI